MPSAAEKHLIVSCAADPTGSGHARQPGTMILLLEHVKLARRSQKGAPISAV
jgi:hypothetical protein